MFEYGLVYRLVNITFLNDFHDLWNDEEVIKYTAVRENLSLYNTEQKLMNWIGEMVFAVLKDDEFIGVVGCPSVNKKNREYGFFYQFKRSEWGKGYASEAAEWVIAYMRRNYGTAVLYADVIPDNIASEKIVKHLGFITTGESKANVKGNIMTVKHYKLNIE